MRKLTEAEILKIYIRRELVENACRACNEYFERLNIVDNTHITVKQAKEIVKWEVRFLRIKMRMTDTVSKKEFSDTFFPIEVEEAVEHIKRGVAYARKTLIGPRLASAIGILQAAAHANDSKTKNLHVFASDEKACSFVTSADDSADAEGFDEYLQSSKAQEDEKKMLIKQRFRTWGESIRYLNYHYTENDVNNAIIKEYLKNMRANEEIKKAKTKTERLIQRLNRIDENVITKARSDIKAKYELIKNNHEALDVWLDIVKSAYAIANKNVDEFLDKVDADKKHREKIKADVMKGFVSLAMSPFMLNFFVDPALQMASGIVSKFGALAAELSQASTSTANNNSIMSELQRQFFTFLTIVGRTASSHEHTIRKIDEMRKNSPVEYVDLMKQFSQYKLDGVAKEMSQAFDPGSNVWNGHTPEYIIKAQRMKLLRKEQASYSKDQWEELKKTDYRTLLENITLDLTRQYKEASKLIFKNISAQYPDKNDVTQLKNIIKHFSFDENTSGPFAFKSGNRKALTQRMADQIEISIIMKYASMYDPFFGGDSHYGDKNAELINNKTFDPYENSHFGLKPNHQGIAIINYLIKKMPEKKDVLEPLKKVGWMEYMREIWEIRTTPEQLGRQKILNELIQEYTNADIVTKLKSTVFKFAAEKDIVIREDIRPTIKHEWASEQSLRDHARALLKPFIEDADKYKSMTEKQFQLSERIINTQKIIHEAPSASDDKTMQQITDSSRILKV